MAMKRPGPVLRWFSRAPYVLYRTHLGWLMGSRFLLLTTVGRKTEATRRSTLEVAARSGGAAASALPTLWVFASRGRHTDWYANAIASGEATVDWMSRRFAVHAHALDVQERSDLLADYRRRHPKAAALLGKGMLGAEYADDPASLGRLAGELRALRLEPDARKH
jgi:deazaflavin-dependent oxidoreductase (nitroreductase family)